MGIARLIKNGWIGFNGVARRFFTTDVTLHDLALGSTVVYNNKNYTVIAKDYCVSGDTILWDVTASKSRSYSEKSTTSPFGTSRTNNATVYYYSDGAKGTITGYGWMIPAKALGRSSLSQGSPFMPYFASNTQRKRATAYYCPDYTSTDNEDAISDSRYYVNTSGTIGSTGYYTSNIYKKYDTYWAYSVKGTLLVKQNTAGNWVLQI